MPVYREQLPSGAFARWVECTWSLESQTATTGHRVPPDGCIDLLYERGKGLRIADLWPHRTRELRPRRPIGPPSRPKPNTSTRRI